MSKSFNEALLDVVASYREAGQTWPAGIDEICSWALDQNEWSPSRADKIRLFKSQMREAMRGETHVGKAGRPVRTYLPAVFPKLKDGKRQLVWVWDDVRTAPEVHMVAALHELRRSHRNDVRCAQAQVADYNERAAKEGWKQMELDWDFNKLDDDETEQDATG